MVKTLKEVSDQTALDMGSGKQKNNAELLHIAIIMDGNGRWAKQRDLPRSAGHRAGTETARRVVEECIALGIKYLTLYTFSKENWKRPKDEVGFLFDLLKDFLQNETASLVKQGVRLNVLGEIAELPFATRKALEFAMEKTKKGKNLVLNLALNYSGRDEIARACAQCIEAGLQADTITPEVLSEHLYTKGQPDPDLVIRTSGEQRVSNFLLFQAAYSEFYFTKTYWPDFTAEHFRKAVEDFKARDRRFGSVANKI